MAELRLDPKKTAVVLIDLDHSLRDLPRMEVGEGAVQRQPLQRIYRCLASSLRTTCSPVRRRVETSAFHRHGHKTTHCRRIVRRSGTHVRVIVRFRLDDEAITLQTNAFHAMSNPKGSKGGIHPATFKLADLLGSQGLHNRRFTR